MPHLQTEHSLDDNPNVHDLRQRFFIENSPVRGDVVRLKRSYASIIAQRDYPTGLQCLLGEMLAAVSLLMGTVKIRGRLSLQLQSNDEHSLLNWAMAECDHDGSIRALASHKADSAEQQHAWQQMVSANEAFAQLGVAGKGVLFINIQPEHGDAYQGIVERSHDNLADCLAHYQKQSAQIPTLIQLGCDALQAGGMLVQLLPRHCEEEQEHTDSDLWPRLSMLTRTLKRDELTTLAATEILHRLYHEEEVVIPEPTPLQFACSCSQDKCTAAIVNLGKAQAEQICDEHGGHIEMDCGFCGAVYRFDKQDVAAVFAG